MKDTKFKVYDYKEKSFLNENVYLDQHGRLFTLHPQKGICYMDMSRFLPLQYIGHQDNTRKDIYCGDIVTFKCADCSAIHKGVICWVNELACWGIKKGEEIYPLMCPVDPNDGSQGIGLMSIGSVVGDIFNDYEMIAGGD